MYDTYVFVMIMKGDRTMYVSTYVCMYVLIVSLHDGYGKKVGSVST